MNVEMTEPIIKKKKSFKKAYENGNENRDIPTALMYLMRFQNHTVKLLKKITLKKS